MTGKHDPYLAIRNLKRGVSVWALLLALAVGLFSWLAWRTEEAASLRQFS